MVPPPVTPSPHRFVIKKPKKAASQPRLPPSIPIAQQFNATPRFQFGPSQRQNASDIPYSEETPSTYQYSTSAQPTELIKDASDEDDFDTYESIESAREIAVPVGTSADEDDDYDPRRRSSKRRRLSVSPILDSQDLELEGQQDEDGQSPFHRQHDEFENLVSSNSVVSSPPVQALHRPPSSNATPRFILPSTPAPVPPSTPANVQAATFVKPPRFRPPDCQDQEQQAMEPLPDIFSPQRRGQKFLAGGIAAEVIGWLMNLGSSTPTFASTRPREDAWVMELVVDEVRGGVGAGITLISGRPIRTALMRNSGLVADTSGTVKVILAGNGVSEGFQNANKVEMKKKIRIKNPVWEIVLDEVKWGVAVTWEVQS